ncbi:MAG: helix-turn-helix transcriptional regulator [Tyzzerella sp.]|nr:helix-turn-helix transcriptional regulator [Tyzzerella sp.]
MAFGETLTSLRKAKGLSQEQLAESLNIARQTISKWELNQSTPDMNYIAKLSEFFNVSTDYLIKGENEKENSALKTETLSSGNIIRTANTSSDKVAYKWCFLLGIISIIISFGGIIAFGICSAMHPWGATIGSMYFEGLMGFLLGTKSFWFFAVLVITLIAGISLASYGIIKQIKRTEDEK